MATQHVASAFVPGVRRSAPLPTVVLENSRAKIKKGIQRALIEIRSSADERRPCAPLASEIDRACAPIDESPIPRRLQNLHLKEIVASLIAGGEIGRVRTVNPGGANERTPPSEPRARASPAPPALEQLVSLRRESAIGVTWRTVTLHSTDMAVIPVRRTQALERALDAVGGGG